MGRGIGASKTGQSRRKSERKRQQEIEADEFSGFVLSKLVATLLQAQAAIKLAADDGDDTYSTHTIYKGRRKSLCVL